MISWSRVVRERWGTSRFTSASLHTAADDASLAAGSSVTVTTVKTIPTMATAYRARRCLGRGGAQRLLVGITAGCA